MNTARLVERSLSSACVLRGNVRSLRAQVQALPASERRYLLFPSAESRDARELAESSFPESVVVVDGTWPMARALLRAIPELRELPHIRLSPLAPSRYRIRRPPNANALSTLESIALLLGSLEPEVDLRALVGLFDRMIDLNVEARVPSAAGPRFKRRALRPHRFPELLRQSAEGAVALYAEGLKANGEARRLAATVVHGDPHPGALLAREGGTLGELLAERPPSTIIVTWQTELARILLQHGFSRVLLLRGIAADYLSHRERAVVAQGTSIPPRSRLGTLEETLLRLGGSEVSASDRVTRRLSATVSLWRLLLAQAAET